jgi:hypothetical protein
LTSQGDINEKIDVTLLLEVKRRKVVASVIIVRFSNGDQTMGTENSSMFMIKVDLKGIKKLPQSKVKAL